MTMVLLVAFLVVAVILTTVGNVKRVMILSLVGGAFWILSGVASVMRSTAAWDIYFDFMFLGVIFGAAEVMTAFSYHNNDERERRTKAAAAKTELTRPRTQQEQWDKSQQEADDLYRSTHLPRANRHRRNSN